MVGPTAEVHRGLRERVRDRLEARVLARSRPLDVARWTGPSIVFAPHPDDEVLGCGGTILRLRDAGAPVRIVFLTDGATSHARFMPADALRERREAEALAAAASLGVEASQVRFLRHPDGRLATRQAAAVEAVREEIGSARPARIFAPHARDQLGDHEAAHAAVRAGALAHGAPLVLYAYPIWLWDRWPWLRQTPRGVRGRLRALLAALLGARAVLRELSVRVDAAALLPRKRAALACHRSQMQRPPERPDWPVLSDVAGGEFLDRLLRPYELFQPIPIAGGAER